MRLGRRAQPQGRDVLLDHVLHTIDGERQEIASRLHDGPQQRMTAIRLLADGAQHALETGQTEQAGRTLERLQQLTMEAADERSEERRGGKECRSWWAPYHSKK